MGRFFARDRVADRSGTARGVFSVPKAVEGTSRTEKGVDSVPKVSESTSRAEKGVDSVRETNGLESGFGTGKAGFAVQISPRTTGLAIPEEIGIFVAEFNF